ncbi:MAG: hypothetical protein AAGD11_18070 [Planctomycetota bacterium]
MAQQSDRKLRMQGLEQRTLMAGDLMFAADLAAATEAVSDHAAKLAATELTQVVVAQPIEKMSGDPDAGNLVVPNPMSGRNAFRPQLADRLRLFNFASGDGDASDPTASNPARAASGTEKPVVGHGVESTGHIEDLRTDLGGRLGDRHEWAMDGENNSGENTSGENTNTSEEDNQQQCQTEQCHTPDDDEKSSEERKRETVSPFGNPEDQQGHTPEEEKKDTSGVGDVEENAFFSEPEELPDKGYEGQQVGGPIFASTPVPDFIAIDGGTVDDAEEDAEDKRAGFVDPGNQLSEAERREALKWSRDADRFFDSIGTKVDPLINPSPDDGEARPPKGEAPIPDNGLADPPKPIGGSASLAKFG